MLFELAGDVHVTQPFKDLRIDHIGDDGLGTPRQVFVQQPISFCREMPEARPSAFAAVTAVFVYALRFIRRSLVPIIDAAASARGLKR